MKLNIAELEQVFTKLLIQLYEQNGAEIEKSRFLLGDFARKFV